MYAKTPEQWLEQTSPEKKVGIFKLFLGYAPGVGKTFNMLSEATGGTAVVRTLSLGSSKLTVAKDGRACCPTGNSTAPEACLQRHDF